MPSFTVLPPQQDVYRAASNQTWIDSENSKFLPDAFKLRKRDVAVDSGVSVLITEDCPTLEDAARFSHRDRVRAVCRLKVEQVRDLDLGLDVIQDAQHHGYISGLPFTEDESDLVAIKQINDFAEALAFLSAICRT